MDFLDSMEVLESAEFLNSLVWYGLVWFGMVRYSMVGLVWFGRARGGMFGNVLEYSRMF